VSSSRPQISLNEEAAPKKRRSHSGERPVASLLVKNVSGAVCRYKEATLARINMFGALELTTILRVLLGIYLIVGSYAVARFILVTDLEHQFEKIKMRSPYLMSVVVRSNYIVVATGCATILICVLANFVVLIVFLCRAPAWFNL
jgi:hypothetical protein